MFRPLFVRSKVPHKVAWTFCPILLCVLVVIEVLMVICIFVFPTTEFSLRGCYRSATMQTDNHFFIPALFVRLNERLFAGFCTARFLVLLFFGLLSRCATSRPSPFLTLPSFSIRRLAFLRESFFLRCSGVP